MGARGTDRGVHELGYAGLACRLHQQETVLTLFISAGPGPEMLLADRLAWPKSCWMCRNPAPRLSMCVAQEWRRVCGVASVVSHAPSAPAAALSRRHVRWTASAGIAASAGLREVRGELRVRLDRGVHPGQLGEAREDRGRHVVDGAAQCWGDNGDGVLGNGEGDGFESATPVAVEGLGTGMAAIDGLRIAARGCWSSDGLLVAGVGRPASRADRRLGIAGVSRAEAARVLEQPDSSARPAGRVAV